jgi:hypothetical protein
MVEQAEALGLEVDGRYLGYYRPCFDSELKNSMTTMYRLFGAYERPIGRDGPDTGEAIHRSALDRGGIGYAPPNLSRCLESGRPLAVVETTRIARGTPCGPMP